MTRQSTGRNSSYNVGIYVRLSQEDMREGESLSIENQKKMLTDYVSQQAGWNLVGIYEDEYNLRLIQFDTETAVKPHKITALGAKRQTESRYFCFMEI